MGIHPQEPKQKDDCVLKAHRSRPPIKAADQGTPNVDPIDVLCKIGTPINVPPINVPPTRIRLILFVKQRLLIGVNILSRHGDFLLTYVFGCTNVECKAVCFLRRSCSKLAAKLYCFFTMLFAAALRTASLR